MKQIAKKQIEKVQQENRKQYNLRRRQPRKYQINDLVAIKRTQLGSGLKLRSNYLGPYRIVKVKSNDTYDVIKEGDQEGPMKTSTCAGYLKGWVKANDDFAPSGTDEESERPNCGIESLRRDKFYRPRGDREGAEETEVK